MRGRRWIITLAWTVVGSLAATYAFGGASWRTPWQRVVEQTFTTMLFAGSCATLCVYGLPIVVPSARRRLSFPFDWLAILGALVVFATVGSLAGAAAAILLGGLD